ncbi:hypothetical protein F4808DRAFT_440978 [Astrocystis sublimbata]|nr:hypothetical protein F4808DRAFT_440978 [Astrocystis sublimbata]
MLRVGTAPPEERRAMTHPPPPRAPQAMHHSAAREQHAARSQPYDSPTKHNTYSPRHFAIDTTGSPTHTQSQHQHQHQHQHGQRQPSTSSFRRRANAPSLPPPSSQAHNIVNHNHRSSINNSGSINNSSNNTELQLAENMALTGDRRGGSPNRSAVHDTTSSASSHQQARSPATADTTPKSAFGFLASFTSRMTNPTHPSPSGARTDDDLCDLDIEAALFPPSAAPPLSSATDLRGNGSNGEAFSPAAYKNLQANATGLLHRMQDAYVARTVALRELQAEREAAREEMDEMQLRARHFRTQLETMAAKAAEQENMMQQLVSELKAERQARIQEERHREKMLDLCVDGDERKRWRASNSTVKSDMSIDTDVDSVASESIFSRCRSPTALTIATENESCLDVPDALHTPHTPTTPICMSMGGGSPRPSLHLQQRGASTLSPPKKSAPQLTAFQRLVKGISASNETTDGCVNCKGQDASVAWDTVSLLRDENIALKQRVAHLDVAVEGALDVVYGIGL